MHLQLTLLSQRTPSLLASHQVSNAFRALSNPTRIKLRFLDELQTQTPLLCALCADSVIHTRVHETTRTLTGAILG